MTANPGTWRQHPTTYAYQWIRCDGDGHSNCADIPGATQSGYKPVPGDVGFTLEVRVVAHNLYGDSLPATSSPSDVIASPTGGTQARPDLEISLKNQTPTGFTVVASVNPRGADTTVTITTQAPHPALPHTQGTRQSPAPASGM